MSYQSLIMKATGCSDREAAIVEELMRNEYSTLDGLYLAKFNKAARGSYEAYQYMMANPVKYKSIIDSFKYI